MAERTGFDTLAPEFRIEIDGSEVPEKVRADLVAVRVLEDIHATGMFSFTLNCWDTVEMKVKWIDDPLFKEGKTVVIHMGYRDQMKKLFTGEINGLEPEFHTSEAPVLTVRGYDRCHRLMRQRKTKSYLAHERQRHRETDRFQFGPEPKGRRQRRNAGVCFATQSNRSRVPARPGGKNRV